MRSIRDNPQDQSKEHIGHILVAVKNIPIVTLAKAVQMKPRWIKVIGLSKNWRPHKPEILMNLMITTRDYLTCDKADVPESKTSSHDSFVINENPIPCMLTSQGGLFIRLLQEEGLLQVGNIDTDCDVFTVQLIIKNARYLENVSHSTGFWLLDTKNFHFSFLQATRTPIKNFSSTICFLGTHTPAP